jgi:hypothetical protein
MAKGRGTFPFAKRKSSRYVRQQSVSLRPQAVTLTNYQKPYRMLNEITRNLASAK